VYIGNLDAEAERITEDLGLTGAAPPLALDEAGHQRVNAIILAGGKLPHAFAELVGTDIKGLIDLAGRTSLERVVDALRATAGVQRLVLVADKAAFVHHPVAENLDGIIDEGPDSWHNLMRAVRLLNADQRILISSVDAPLVTAEALEELLSRCDPAADLCLPVTAQGPRRGFFAQRFWSLLPLRGGLVGHTSHLLVDPRLILRSQDFAERFLSRLWGEAGPAGLQFTLRLLLGWFFPRLRFDDKGLAHQLEFLTGARRCQLVPLERPELVLDLDRPADLEEVRGVLKKHEG
jgi:molybdopterin-guanine dinucleotide biosynthesis protein A